MKIYMKVDIPAKLATAWFEHLRAFDKAHSTDHFEVSITAADPNVHDKLVKMYETMVEKPGAKA